ncbi:hypothetical protein CSP48_004014 [Salmonella enterica subsp. arizonae]|nr:hypothetical protein [Salmonella enterica subsp. arizonae]
MISNTYRVVATSRASGKKTNYYEGGSACMATAFYEDLLKRKMFMEDFKVELQRLDPVIVMESD